MMMTHSLALRGREEGGAGVAPASGRGSWSSSADVDTLLHPQDNRNDGRQQQGPGRDVHRDSPASDERRQGGSDRDTPLPTRSKQGGGAGAAPRPAPMSFRVGGAGAAAGNAQEERGRRRDRSHDGDEDHYMETRESLEGTPMDEDDGDDVEVEGEGMDDMAAMMGFGGFGSTKGTKVAGNAAGSVHKAKKTEYRQYMNRIGGFNRPLSPSR